MGDRNRALTAESFEYRRCRSCRAIFLANVPADLGRYYPPDYYDRPSITELDRWWVPWQAPVLELLRPFAAAGSLIEIGAAHGSFARAAQLAGFDVTAIEMDASCCRHLEDVVGVNVIQSDAPELALAALEPARAIVLWHTLEHLVHPWDVVEQAARQLEPGGVFAVSMPNPDSLQFRLLGARWRHVDAPRHLFLIPFATLRARMDDVGLELARATTSDPAGRCLNAFGWEAAIMRHPASRSSTRVTRNFARLLALGLGPFEHRDLKGSTYTAVFVKR